LVNYFPSLILETILYLGTC